MFLNLQLLILLTLTIRTDITAGNYLAIVEECTTSSPDLSDVQLIYTYYYNKDVLVQFKSTVGEFVGFTELGVNISKRWNSGTYLQQLRGELDRYCIPNLQKDYSTILDKTAQPKVKLSSEQEFSPGNLAILVCSAYDFYPPVIDVYWLRNNKKVTSDPVYLVELANGDWYYQVHSHLEYTPRSGETISCVVEHSNFTEPMIYDWDPSLPEIQQGMIAAGASGLMLGFVMIVVGVLYYKKKTLGKLQIPT
ncbi:H-2 class II histocompatibility antigen, E-S beta chain-like [Hoplias malabaricus]|uniref:H-2 class II histocompatibility antigen, E-S beta chain-like n=1 Tax=Hoplias malabaricus TaxID=27720 RepID=UPI003462170A